MSTDEILQLILNELSNPVAFTLISKRHHEFSQDPYVRASYFLARYGRIQALYWALGRGKLLNERVIDVRACSFPHSLGARALSCCRPGRSASHLVSCTSHRIGLSS